MSNLTFSEDFQLYTLDVEQDRKCYSRALKKKQSYTLPQRDLGF